MNYHARMRQYQPKHDPRLIEAYMRLEHSTLDGLTAYEFENEARIAALCIEHGGRAQAERLAVSMGLPI
jgi:hypothetical protein